MGLGNVRDMNDEAIGECLLPRIFLSLLSRLRQGFSASAEHLNASLFKCLGLELRRSAIVGSVEVYWVVDIRHNDYLKKDFLSTVDSKLRRVNAIEASLNDWLENGPGKILHENLEQTFADVLFKDPPEEPSEASVPSHVIVVSSVVLLAFVYQYLTGNVDSGGSKAYSRTSLDYRDIYVAIVLFLGAYVWIKFREAAPKGVHPRILRDKQGRIIKEVYEARLTPPMWNGEKVPRLDLGRFATPQEAHTKFLIAAFYYGRNAGLLDGWFQVPSMSAEERSLTGSELRTWVIGQAKTVYKDFKRKEAESALLLQELLETCEGQATPGRVEVNVEFSMASSLNSAEHQQPTPVNLAENSGMGINHGLECASHCFDGIHEGLALPNDHSLGSQEGSALPVSQLPPNTESGTSLNCSDPLDLLLTRLDTFQKQIEECRAQVLQLKRH